MSKDSDREKERALQEQNRRLQEESTRRSAAFDTQVAQTRRLSPWERQQGQSSLDFFNWDEGKNKQTLDDAGNATDTLDASGQPISSGPKDIMNAPGLGAHLDLFRRAKEGGAEDSASGARSFGAQSADPNLLAAMNTFSKSQREQRAQGGLSDAYNMRRAEARGDSSSMMAQMLQKGLGLTNAQSGAYGTSANAAGNAMNSWASFRPAPSPIWGILGSALGGVGTALSGGLSAGGVFNRA